MPEQAHFRIGQLTVDEWCNYWADGNTACVEDGYSINDVTRCELAQAAQLIAAWHFSLKRIASLDYSRAAINGMGIEAVSIAKVALEVSNG